jgi:uncharacterized protein YkwD
MRLLANRLILKMVVLAVFVGLTQAAAPAEANDFRKAYRRELRTRSLICDEILRLTNVERRKAGLAPLRINDRLGVAAIGHAGNMARQSNMNHTLDGKDAPARILAAGYNYSAYGENIAQKYASAAAVVAGWMASPVHNGNILNGTFTEIGIGVARKDAKGDWYYCQVFGKPR